MARNKYVPRVLPLGDSLTWGFDAPPAAAWRSSLYFALLAAGQQIQFVGNPTTSNGGSGAGPSGVLAIDPYNDGINGAQIAGIWGNSGTDVTSALAPDICMLEGGTNNVTAGQNSATVLAAWSTYLDVVNAWLLNPQAKIIVQQIFKRYDNAGLDTVSQAVNAGLPALIAGKSYATRCSILPCYNFCPQANYAADNIHLLNTGADIVGPLMAPYLLPVISAIKTAPLPGP